MNRTRIRRIKEIHQNIFKRHWQDHIGIYAILIMLFIIGFIIGSINAAFAKENVKVESQNYILEFIDSLKTQEIDNEILFKESISANVKPIILIMLFGLVIIGIPFIFIYIGLYSYSVGFTITSIFSSLGVTKGIAFIFTLMIPQEIILLPTIFIIAVNSILFSKTILKINNRNIELKKELLKYLVIFIAGLLITIGTAFFETYIGSYLVKVVMNAAT